MEIRLDLSSSFKQHLVSYYRKPQKSLFTQHILFIFPEKPEVFAKYFRSKKGLIVEHN